MVNIKTLHCLINFQKFKIKKVYSSFGNVIVLFNTQCNHLNKLIYLEILY